MNLPASSAAAARLQRLAAYLAQDPANAALLAEACETAIACGQHERADSYLAAARQLSLRGAEWTFRRARLCIARRELGEAAGALEQLRAELGEHPVLAHDLAYVRLLQGDAGGARALLQPWMTRMPSAQRIPDEQVQALQVVWLRACHRLGRLEEAWDWARSEQAAGRLQPAAGGVASLIALDLDDLPAARALADAALAADAEQMEALVARGCIALAGGDSSAAAALLQRALQCNPDDGRTRSALGFASLLAGDLPQARSQLERAVCTMADHVDTWHALGWTRLLQGERDAALAAFRSALDLDGDSAESHGALALALALTGDRTQAGWHLQLAESLDADGISARCARAFLAGEVNNPAQLEALTKRLLAQWRLRP